jgi:hypothetical protein
MPRPGLHSAMGLSGSFTLALLAGVCLLGGWLVTAAFFGVLAVATAAHDHRRKLAPK